MDNLDVDRVAAWLVKAGLAGMPEADLLHGFCEECRSIGMDLSTAVAVIDTLHPVYEGRAFLWRAGGTQDNPLVEYGSTAEGEAVSLAG
jgi:adenylate cyclase